MRQFSMIIIVLFCLFIFSGCSNPEQESKSFDFDVIPEKITLKKDITLINSKENSSYNSLIITQQTKINQIITSLNEINYEVSGEIYDILGYQYIIEWDEVRIYVINDKHFYYNDDTNTTNKIIKGDFSFLDDFTFLANS